MTRSLVSFASFALLALYNWSATVEAQVALNHKFPDGVKSTSVTTIKTDQKMTIAEMDIVTASTQTLTVTSVNGTRADNGELVITHRIDGLKAELDVAGNRLSFDSKNPDVPPPGSAIDSLLDVFKALTKSEWTVKYDKDDRVIAVDGRSDALKSLPEEMRKATEKQFDPIYLAQLANDELATVPSDPVKKGDTWELETIVRLEAGQTFTFKKTYQYDGTVEQDGKQLHKITDKTTSVQYDMEANPASPLKYIRSDLKVADSAGTTLFDNEEGKVVSRDSKVQITGSIVFEAGGNKLPATLDLTMQQKTKSTSP